MQIAIFIVKLQKVNELIDMEKEESLNVLLF